MAEQDNEDDLTEDEFNEYQDQVNAATAALFRARQIPDMNVSRDAFTDAWEATHQHVQAGVVMGLVTIINSLHPEEIPEFHIPFQQEPEQL